MAVPATSAACRREVGGGRIGYKRRARRDSAHFEDLDQRDAGGAAHAGDVGGVDAGRQREEQRGSVEPRGRRHAPGTIRRPRPCRHPFLVIATAPDGVGRHLERRRSYVDGDAQAPRARSMPKSVPRLGPRPRTRHGVGGRAGNGETGDQRVVASAPTSARVEMLMISRWRARAGVGIIELGERDAAGAAPGR